MEFASAMECGVRAFSAKAEFGSSSEIAMDQDFPEQYSFRDELAFMMGRSFIARDGPRK
jgi:hypothetical protein